MLKKVVEHVATAIIAMIGVIGGTIWAVKTEWDLEPTILVAVSTIQLIAFIASRSIGNKTEEFEAQQLLPTKSNEKNMNEQNVNVNVSVGQGNNPIPLTDSKTYVTQTELPREEIIELMKGKMQILFIDDDKKFSVVQNLKDGGWRLTKTVEDIKNVDIPIVQKSRIFFVDINGVGKLLN